MFMGAIWQGREAVAFLEVAETAAGTVLKLKRERGATAMPKDHPIVQFVVSQTGREEVFRSKVGLWPSPFEAGDPVEVLYDPADPERAEINSFWTIWLPGVAFVTFGSLCLGAGLLTVKWTRRPQSIPSDAIAARDHRPDKAAPTLRGRAISPQE